MLFITLKLFISGSSSEPGLDFSLVFVSLAFSRLTVTLDVRDRLEFKFKKK